MFYYKDKVQVSANQKDYRLGQIMSKRCCHNEDASNITDS